MKTRQKLKQMKRHNEKLEQDLKNAKESEISEGLKKILDNLECTNEIQQSLSEIKSKLEKEDEADISDLLVHPVEELSKKAHKRFGNLSIPLIIILVALGIFGNYFLDNTAEKVISVFSSKPSEMELKVKDLEDKNEIQEKYYQNLIFVKDKYIEEIIFNKDLLESENKSLKEENKNLKNENDLLKNQPEELAK